MTQEQIIEGCRQGDNAARRALYQHYAPLMLGVVWRYVSERATAEDLLHDGFVTLYTKIGDWRGEGPFDAWCRRIFVNTALSFLRKRSNLGADEDISELPPGRIEGVAPQALERLSAEELRQAIESLPDGYRTVLNLYAVEGYSHAEIGQMLGISETTSRSQYIRAKARLAAKLGIADTKTTKTKNNNDTDERG